MKHTIAAILYLTATLLMTGHPLHACSSFAVYEFLSGNQDTFDNSAAMKLLEKIRVNRPEYATACSMVFDPQNNEILIALRQDYNRIYKVSLRDKTIETLRGFDQYHKATLDSEGILVSSLVNWD